MHVSLLSCKFVVKAHNTLLPNSERVSHDFKTVASDVVVYACMLVSRARARACVRASVRASVRARARVRVRACVCVRACVLACACMLLTRVCTLCMCV